MKIKFIVFTAIQLFMIDIHAQIQSWQNNSLTANIIGGVTLPPSTPFSSIACNTIGQNGDVIRTNPWSTIDGNYLSNSLATLYPSTSILNQVRNVSTVRSIDVNGMDKWMNLIQPYPYPETDNWNITNYFINQHIGINDITTDATGNVFVMGTFLQIQEILDDHLNYPPGATPPLPPSCMGGVDFGNGNVLTVTNDCSDKNGFLVKYDVNGNYMWSKLIDYEMTSVNFGSPSFDPKKVVIDPLTNDVVIIYELNGTTFIDGQIVSGTSPQIVASRLSSNGNFLNHYHLGYNNQPNTFQSLQIDGNGKFIIGYNLIHNAGYTCCNTLTLGSSVYNANNQTAAYADFVLARFSPTTNTFDWQVQSSTNANEMLSQLTLDANNDIYLNIDKRTTENILFNGLNTFSFTGQLIQKYTNNGTPDWMHCSSINNLTIFDEYATISALNPNRLYTRGKVFNTNGKTLYNLSYLITHKFGTVNGTMLSNNYNLYSNHSTGLTGEEITQFTDLKLFTAPETGIHTGFCDTIEHYCAGDTIMIPYTVNAANFFLSGNIFTAQLSDANGNFGSPTTIGTISSNTSGFITGIIPQNISAGNAYQIRVIASLPYYIGAVRPTTISISAQPQFTIQVPQHTCVSNGLVLQTSSVFAHYLWTLPLYTANTDSIYTTTAGNYAVEVTDGNGCKASQSVTITNQPIAEICGNGIDDDCDGLIDTADPDCCPTQINIYGDSTLCFEQQLILTASVSSPNAQITWLYPDSATLNDSTMYSYQPGVYTVIAVINGACTISRQINVVQAPNITWSLTGNKVCNGTNIGNLDLQVNGAAPFSFQWLNNLTNMSDQLEDHNGIPTNTSYTGTITDSFGCNTPADLRFEIGHPIQIDILGDTLLCGSTSGMISISGTGGFPLYDAQGDPTYIGAGSFVQNLGTYSVTLTDAIGCAATTNYTITAPCACNFPNLVITVKNAKAYTTSGVPVYCHNNTISLALNPIGGASYLWKGPNNHTSIGRVLTIPNATSINTGLYKVYVTRGTCQDSLYASVIVQPQIVVTPMPATLTCPNSLITLYASANTTPVTYQWTKSTLPVNPTFVVNATTTGTYAVRVTDNYQCSAAATTKIGMFQPNVITPSFNLQNNNSRFRLNVNGATLTSTNASYLWTGPNNFTANLKQPSAIPFTPSNYGIYTVQVITMQGCTLTASINVRPAMKMDEETSTLTESLSNIDIKLYPNPANDFIQIETANTIENLMITTLLGKQVYNEITSASLVDIKELPVGVYVLHIKTNQEIIIRRFVKQ